MGILSARHVLTIAGTIAEPVGLRFGCAGWRTDAEAKLCYPARLVTGERMREARC